MSLIVLASPGEEDYIFSLLTGYCDPPAGIEVKEGMAYNPYFAGGAIAMPQQLFPDSVEYEDGTTHHHCQFKVLMPFLLQVLQLL